MDKILTKSILVVDDSVSINKNISDTLTLEGYNVCMAYDGLHAIDYIQEIKIDLIITDISMPKMDGLELIRFVRTGSEFPNTPIIVITADSSKQTELNALETGANQFFLKPFDDDNFINSIAMLLADKK